MKVALFVVLIACLVALASAEINQCSKSENFSVSSLKMSPAHPVAGQNVDIMLEGQLKQEIAGGSVQLEIAYAGIRMFTKSFAIAETAAGAFTFTVTQKFPSFVPNGKYTATLKAVDTNGAEFACVNFQLEEGVDNSQFALNLKALVHDDAMIQEINASGATWTAAHSDRFKGMTWADAVQMLGTKLDRPLNEDLVVPTTLHVDAPPATFDARTQWPSCIHPIRDQQQCGSCWAFGATESLSDRICIQGGPNVVLSPEELVSCDTGNYGCQGGYLDVAWSYMNKNGVTIDSKFPYTAGGGVAPPCGNHKSDTPRYHATAPKSFNGMATMQTEIMTNGPVEVAFNVYQDFFAYSSGVYQHKTGGLAGGHAVKAIGWGVSGSTPYWIIANSWGTGWGQSGIFWILRGKNECGIESNVVAANYQK